MRSGELKPSADGRGGGADPRPLLRLLAVVQLSTEVRGRVFVGFELPWQSGRRASLAIGGVVVDPLAVQSVYLFGGLLLLIAGAIGLTGVLPHRTLTGAERSTPKPRRGR